MSVGFFSTESKKYILLTRPETFHTRFPVFLAHSSGSLVQVPMLKLAILVSLFSWILVTDIIKGSVKCGGTTYWLLVLSIIPIVLALMAWFRQVLVTKADVKSRVRFYFPLMMPATVLCIDVILLALDDASHCSLCIDVCTIYLKQCIVSRISIRR